MRTIAAFEFPDELLPVVRQARRLEWVTLAYLVSATTIIYLTAGGSQAMKTSWVDDLLSFIPPLCFFAGSRIAERPPTERFPYGFHRAVTVGYLAASIALLAVGLHLLIESLNLLFSGEHPTIGGVQLFGATVWLGWLMLPALTWDAIPALFLGLAKLKLARKLHDKVLFADAEMNRASWMSDGAAALGIIGIGLGYWWADAVAAALISADIVRDGCRNLDHALRDLVDQVPTHTGERRVEEILEELPRHLEQLPWIDRVEVRLREHGHVFFGEAFVVPNDDRDMPDKIRQAVEHARSLDWRVHDIIVTPVDRLSHEEQGNEAEPGDIEA